MKNLRAGITAAAATAALGLGGVALAATATAGNPHTTTSATPCATEQTQLKRAEDKLASLTTKFLAVSAKVKTDKAALHSATSGSATGQAKKALARDKARRAGLLKAKKAQVQRVKHAQARLTKCEAAHPSSTATATSTATSTATASS